MPDSSSTGVAHKWEEISDLPKDVESFRDRELEALSQVWQQQEETIGGEGRIKDFNVEHSREWAIETGIIEGIYTLDRGITQTLIERGIDSAYIPHNATNRDPELVARIIQAHAEVLEGLFAFVKGERTLSTAYIKELHAALLRHQDTLVVFDQFGQAFEKELEKGSYKKLPNNPRRGDGTIHEYCPPEHVSSEMDRLIELHQEHDGRGIRPHLEAAWIHHAFTQIHPFEDGNGRVARAIASLVFIKSRHFPLVIGRDDRTKYIEALEAADQHDLAHLVRLFAQVQKRALTRAIGRAVDVKPLTSVAEALAATRDLLIDVGKIIPSRYLIAKEHANRLNNETVKRLNGIAESLNTDIARANPDFKFLAGTLGSPPTTELRSVAEKLQYDSNSNEYHQAALLTLGAPGGVMSKIVISFHGIGSGFRGLLAAAAYFQVGDGPPIIVCEDIFRISYEEEFTDLHARYMKWLDASLINGLGEWRRTIV